MDKVGNTGSCGAAGHPAESTSESRTSGRSTSWWAPLGVPGAEFGRKIWRKPFETLPLGFVLGQGLLVHGKCFPCLGNVPPVPVVLPVQEGKGRDSFVPLICGSSAFIQNQTPPACSGAVLSLPRSWGVSRGFPHLWAHFSVSCTTSFWQ